MDIFNKQESNVKSYCNSFPVVFTAAKGVWLHTEDGNKYIDFLAGAGSLNYGHNNDELKKSLIEYIEKDGITHGLDMYTEAKANFLTALRNHIFAPRNLDYKVQFTGPTGTNAVEAAMKLARKITGKTNIVTFTNGFHGCTMGALAATGNQHHRGGAGMPLSGTARIPYEAMPVSMDSLCSKPCYTTTQAVLTNLLLSFLKLYRVKVVLTSHQTNGFKSSLRSVKTMTS